MEKKSVYIMQCRELCKIGVSKNTKQRLKAISIGNPKTEIIWESKKIYNSYKIESALHKMYSNVSVGREWFLIKDIEKLIKEAEFLIEEMRKNETVRKTVNNKSDDLINKVLGADGLIRETEEIKLENKRIQDFTFCILGLQQESDYTDLIYKAVFGKNAKRLREELGITKQDNLRNFFAQEELAKVKSVEMVVSGLVDCGWGYDDVKDFIINSTRKLIAA